MDKVRSPGLTEASILVNSTTERSKDKVSIYGKMAANMTVSGKIIKLLEEESLNGPTVKNISESSKMTCDTDWVLLSGQTGANT